MLSHLRRGHNEFNDTSRPMNPTTSNGERWKSTVSDAFSPRSNSNVQNIDLSRTIRYDALLLAIVRIEDKRNAFYSAEVVSKLRQKEQRQSLINKPCSLYVTDRYLVIFDRATQMIAESIPLENVDPTCVHADAPDTLNDIFMYRLLDRQLTPSNSYIDNRNSSDSSVIVFKCSNNEAKLLVDSIRTATGKPLKYLRSTASDSRSVITDRRTTTDLAFGSGANIIQHTRIDPPRIDPPRVDPPRMGPSYVVNTQQTRTDTQQARTDTQQTRIVTQQSTVAATDYYKRLTEELNKCFDDIELFVRYLEALMEYTKELDRDHRRKERKSTTGLKHMVEKLPDDQYFIDVLQKFKHSFNLLGELKHIIHNPNAPELVHYLLSPLQFILYTLRTKHVNQLKLAQEIWTPIITKEAKELLANCLTSKENEILRNLGPAWTRTADETTAKFSDYRPKFFEGQPGWVQTVPNEGSQITTVIQSTQYNEPGRITHPFTKFDERQQIVTTSVRPSNPINTNGITTNYIGTMVPQPSPMTSHFDSSTVDRSARNGILENYNTHMQNEHAWAIDRKRAGARICAVKADRKAQHVKELTVRRGELIEIEDSSRNWWRARNFRGEVGHVPNNIIEEIEIELRPLKTSPLIPTGTTLHPTLTTTNSRLRNN